MANARALDKRRKSIRNIKKITRTMELIATARFKKAMDRAISANDYTKRITSVVSDLARAGLEVSHPLLEAPDATNNATLLVLTGNRGLCGGYNGNALRMGLKTREALMRTLRIFVLKSAANVVFLDLTSGRFLSTSRSQILMINRSTRKLSRSPIVTSASMLRATFIGWM